MDRIIPDRKQCMEEEDESFHLDACVERLHVIYTMCNSNHIKPTECREIRGWYYNALQDVTDAFKKYKDGQK